MATTSVQVADKECHIIEETINEEASLATDAMLQAPSVEPAIISGMHQLKKGSKLEPSTVDEEVDRLQDLVEEGKIYSFTAICVKNGPPQI